VETDLSLLSLVTNASVMVQMVMGLLLAVSIFSWSIIFQKHGMLKKAAVSVTEFEGNFLSGCCLTQLYSSLTSGRQANAGMALIFEAGFKEFARLRKHESDTGAVLEGAQRAMRVALSRETDKLEQHLPFLATVVSTILYLGLFGLVWGIMNSFLALGNVKQATLAMVAPGISEALVATAMGLFAAIPAVIGYNRYSTDLERLLNRYVTFMEEFSSILYRQSHKK